jgi:hypothetical protein
MAAAIPVMACPAEVASTGGVPKLSVPIRIRDIGEVVAGETAEVKFPYRNLGEAPLVIEKITSSCSCIIPSYTRTLARGQGGVLRAQLLSSTLSNGPAVKLIEIQSNDPEQPVVTLEIRARVRPLFQITPSNPHSVGAMKGETVRQVFSVVPVGHPPAEITSVASHDQGVEARLLPTTDNDGASAYRVEVVVHPVGETTDFARSVVLNTSHSRAPTLRLTIRVVIDESITVSPPLLYLGTLGQEAGTGPPRLITVYRRRGPLRVLEAKADTPALEVEIRPSFAGNHWELAVQYRGGWAPGSKSGKITLVTDDHSSQKIAIPYRAVVE